MPAEKCVEVLKSKFAKHGLSLKGDIVSITTDGVTVMKNVGELIGANQQLCYGHGIQLGVIDVLYQKNKEQKNQNTVDIETSDSNFEESESDNEHNGNVIVEEDIANEDEILAHQELLPIIYKVQKIVKIFKRFPTKKCHIN
ncbi:BED-type domain-containing protein [Caerostris darwini]|uniref:BED-type domain-containing protein n=1 Tax=Caerostris darwini TaxID=1538125 RepID=A0AAV4WHI3_9ARAC|nr:BED-type domain-containing protein [Caerostris darwini]